jgi:hypothetical protein
VLKDQVKEIKIINIQRLYLGLFPGLGIGESIDHTVLPLRVYGYDYSAQRYEDKNDTGQFHKMVTSLHCNTSMNSYIQVIAITLCAGSTLVADIQHRLHAA